MGNIMASYVARSEGLLSRAFLEEVHTVVS